MYMQDRRSSSNPKLCRSTLSQTSDHSDKSLLCCRLGRLDRIRVSLLAVSAGARSPDHESVAGAHLDRIPRTQVHDAVQTTKNLSVWRETADSDIRRER